MIDTLQVPFREFQTVAVTAALREELAPLCTRLHASKIHVHRKQLYYLAKTGRRRIFFVRAGMGLWNAARVLRFLDKVVRPELVINIGFAGALSEGFELGDVVLVTESVSWPSCKVMRLGEGRSLFPKSASDHVIHKATCVTVPKMTLKKKLSRLFLLRDRRAVVDLETYHYAKFCEGLNVPFVAIRCITDRLSDEFLFNLDDITDAHGHVRAAMVFKEAFSNPGIIPHLWRLWRISARAGNNLADTCLLMLRSIWASATANGNNYFGCGRRHRK